MYLSQGMQHPVEARKMGACVLMGYPISLASAAEGIAGMQCEHGDLRITVISAGASSIHLDCPNLVLKPAQACRPAAADSRPADGMLRPLRRPCRHA